MRGLTQKEKKLSVIKTSLQDLSLFLSFVSFVACLTFFLVPLLASFKPLFSSTLSVLKNGKESNSSFLSIFIFTITHSFLSSLLAITIAIPLAFFCANRKFYFKNFLLSLSSIPLTIPAIIIAISYIIFFGNNGLFTIILSKMLKFRINSFLYSLFGIIIAQGFYNFPIAMRMITESWQKVPEDEKECAILLGASHWFLFKSITLPYIFPSILSSFLLIFLFCFFSFVIILLFGGVGSSTIEVEIYKCVNYLFDEKLGAKLCLCEFIFGIFLLNVYSYFKTKTEINTSKIEIKKISEKIKGKLEKTLFILLIFIITFFLLLPIASIFLYSFYSVQYEYSSLYSLTLKAWKFVLFSSSFYKALFNTLYIATSTVIVSILATLFFSYIRIFYLHFSYLDFLILLPLATSSIMLGFGWNVLECGNIISLILSQSSLLWFFTYSQFQLSLIKIPKNLIESSLLLSKSKRITFFKAILPLSYKGLLSGGAFVFAMSASDASLPLMLGIENFNTLALQLFNYASSYRFSESAVIAIILLIISSSCFMIKDNYK
jgi:thiamine ABC transporter, permease protein